MGIREEQRIRTREQILVAAAVEFQHRGYLATSYTAVAQRAGVAKSLVSYHFPSKNDFVRAMFDAAFRENMYPAPIHEPMPPLDDLAKSTVDAAGQEQRDPIVRAALRMQREAAVIPDVELPVPFVRWIARCEMLYAAAVESGDIRPGIDVALEARLLVAQYIGIRDLAAAADDYDGLMEQTVVGSLDRFVAAGATPEAMRSATERAVATMRGWNGVGVERIEVRLSWPGAGALPEARP